MSQYTYSVKRVNDTVTLNYIIESEDNFITITRMKGNERLVIECLPNLNFISYTLYSKDILKASIKRTGNQIQMKLFQDSKITEKTFEYPQNAFLYSSVVLPFLFSKYPFQSNIIIEFPFLIETFDRFGFIQMQVTKTKNETILIDNKSYPSYKLRFNPTGLAASFYYAEFWYSTAIQGLMIQQDMKRGELFQLKSDI